MLIAISLILFASDSQAFLREFVIMIPALEFSLAHSWESQHICSIPMLLTFIRCFICWCLQQHSLPCFNNMCLASQIFLWVFLFFLFHYYSELQFPCCCIKKMRCNFMTMNFCSTFWFVIKFTCFLFALFPGNIEMCLFLTPLSFSLIFNFVTLMKRSSTSSIKSPSDCLPLWRVWQR